MFKIMIVEDDSVIAGVIAGELESWGYGVARVTDFSYVLDYFKRESPQLVLMDLSLPFRSGFHWCAEIRKISRVPIIFISSAADNMNLITALHQGADDFIPKPFNLTVLAAKVQAILRRSYEFSDSAAEPPLDGLQPNELQPGVLICGGAELDLGAMALIYKADKIDLTRNEFRILKTLMEKSGKVISRNEIMRKLWDDESFIDDNTLTVNINRLRKKLEGCGLTNFITTKKGEGYTVSC